MIPVWGASGGSNAGGGQKPLVLVDFANQAYYQNGNGYALASLPGWAYTGSVSGTGATVRYAQSAAGVLTSFATNVPRITDQGLLIEPAATNLSIRSQELDTWALTNATVTANTANAPDGTATADLLTSTGGTNADASRNITIASGATVTMTVYAKQSGARQWFSLLCFQDDFAGAATAYFDLTNGATGNLTVSGPKFSNGSSAIQAATSGWYRCTLTFTTASMTVLPARCYVSAATNGGTPGTGDAVLLWGVQVEATATATSYIPTTTATVTRAADAATLTYSPNGTTATVLYGTSSSASPSPTSPINLGSSSGGAWVGQYVRSVTVR